MKYFWNTNIYWISLLEIKIPVQICLIRIYIHTHMCTHLHTYNIQPFCPSSTLECRVLSDQKLSFCERGISIAHSFLLWVFLTLENFLSLDVWLKWVTELALSHVSTVMTLQRTRAPRNCWRLSPKTLALGPGVWKETQSREWHLSQILASCACPLTCF